MMNNSGMGMNVMELFTDLIIRLLYKLSLLCRCTGRCTGLQIVCLCLQGALQGTQLSCRHTCPAQFGVVRYRAGLRAFVASCPADTSLGSLLRSPSCSARSSAAPPDAGLPCFLVSAWVS